MNLAVLDPIARCQHGLVTQEQVETHFTPRQRKHLVDTKQLLTVRRGVYRMPGGPITWEQQLLAALLLTEGKYVISHQAAARWHGLGNVWQHAGLEFSVAQKASYEPLGVTVHNAPLPDHHIVTSGLFRITSVARTLIDAVAVAPIEKVHKGLDHALSRRLIKVDHLEMAATDVRRPGLPMFSAVDELIATRRENPTQSWLQRRTLRWIKEAGLPAPAVEHPVPTETCTYHVDLAYPDLRLGIECNGFADHGDRTAFDEDATRISEITVTGMRIMPVTTRTPKHRLIHDLETAFAAHRRFLRAR